MQVLRPYTLGKGIGLECHPEPFASLEGKLREGSGSLGEEILRCAQDDKTPGCHPERSEGSRRAFIQQT